MNKTLLILRHAHRDTSEGRLNDNGLDEKGRKQARRFVEYYQHHYKKTVPVIFSSRLARCMETVEPLSDTLGVKIKTSPKLIEQWMDSPSETGQEFEKRVQSFCDEWRQSTDPVTIACSHGDWIPVALEYLTGTSVDLKKGGFVELVSTGKKIDIKSIVQKIEE